MHVVHEYCSDVPFYPVTKFTSRPKSPKQFFNGETGKEENWFRPDSKLAVNFAIFRGAGASAQCRSQEGPWGPGVGGAVASVCRVDMIAMTELCEMRTMEFDNLRPLLEKQMSVDNQPQIFQM